jgi:hypothetical protein
LELERHTSPPILSRFKKEKHDMHVSLEATFWFVCVCVCVCVCVFVSAFSGWIELCAYVVGFVELLLWWSHHGWWLLTTYYYLQVPFKQFPICSFWLHTYMHGNAAALADSSLYWWYVLYKAYDKIKQLRKRHAQVRPLSGHIKP